MNRHLFSWVTFALLASIAAYAGAAATDATPVAPPGDQAGAITETGLVYAYWNERSLTLDLYAPADSVGAPVVVYLPGQFQTAAPPAMVEGLVDEGVIIFVVRYAAGNDGPILILGQDGAHLRAASESVACAIHFAREQASEIGSNDPALVLTGFSFGGGLAAHVAMFGDSLEASWQEHSADGGPPGEIVCEIPEGSTHVDALVGTGGVWDAFVPIYDGKYGRAYQQERVPDLWNFLSSPIEANPDLEVYLLHGDTDSIVPIQNSVDFAAALSDAGYDVHFEPFEGGHSVPVDLVVRTILEALEQ